MANRQYGKIVHWNKQRRYGSVQGEKTKKTYNFQQRDTPRDMAIIENEWVEFEVVRYRGQEVARHITPISPFPLGYRFHNPYNFVRPMRPVDRTQYADKNIQLLGQIAPPPHDRYFGLSGRITCHLKTITPLFVSSSEGVEPDPDNPEHLQYEFFKLGDTKAIPASTLRGAIRSIYEIATNSTYSNLTGNRLSYRLPSDEVQKMMPARIEKGDDKKWYLRLLPGTAPFDVQRGQKKGLYAAPVRFYKACRPPRQRRGRRDSEQPTPIPNAPDDYEHSNPYWAVLVRVKFPPSWRVLGLYESQQEAEQARRQFNVRSETRVRQGWLCKTNQNTDNKSNERFFFREPGRKDVPEHLNLGEKHPALDNYLDLIADYQDRHQKDVAKRKQAGVADCKAQPVAFSRHVLRKDERRQDELDGALVYVRLEPANTSYAVKFIAPVSWSRIAYDNAIGDLLPNYLRRPVTNEELDPASRLFGWVSDGLDRNGERLSTKERKKPQYQAYAGRLRFSHALLQEEGAKMDKQILNILGSPKPTTTRFYLTPPDGKPRDGRDDITAGYDGNGGNNRLRGRKVYRHYHPAENRDKLNNHLYQDKRVTQRYPNIDKKLGLANESEDKSDQNRTVRDPEGAGAIFTFTLDFHNLAEVELGALLWALTLGGKGYHRLGYAKPLGYGSVTITVQKVEQIDFEKRYQSLEHSGLTEISLETQQKCIHKFQRAFVYPYTGKFGEDLDRNAQQQGSSVWEAVYEREVASITDLFALVGKEQPHLPVHYPLSPDPYSNGQFEWFVGNTRKSGPGIELPLAGENELPLIHKHGTIHD